ncbi:MAG: hypothetical protein ACXWPS_17935 [Ktedonobacteraceae bacterium]
MKESINLILLSGTILFPSLQSVRRALQLTEYSKEGAGNQLKRYVANRVIGTRKTPGSASFTHYQASL